MTQPLTAPMCPYLTAPKAKVYQSRIDPFRAHAYNIPVWGLPPKLAAETLALASRTGMRAITEEVKMTIRGAEVILFATTGGFRLLDVLDKAGSSLLGQVAPETLNRLCLATLACLRTYTGDKVSEDQITVTSSRDWLVPVHGNYATRSVLP